MDGRQQADSGDPKTRRAQMAREQTIMKLSTLVRAIARRYQGRGIPLEDLVQVGYVGLIQAVDRFDPTRRVPLRAYAARTIEGEIMHMFRDQKWAIRVPRGLQEASTRVVRVRGDLTQSLGREPTLAEIAEASGLSITETDEAIAVRNAFSPKSLSGDPNPIDPDLEASPEDELGCDEPGFATVLDRHELATALRRLPSRERQILALRVYGDLTQSEIAKRVGVSQMQISRLLRQAEDTARAQLDAGAA
jgi:RNA polymerase sigma-B factor